MKPDVTPIKKTFLIISWSERGSVTIQFVPEGQKGHLLMCDLVCAMTY